MTDGLNDTRPRVRDSAAAAIKRVLRDKHALAVPARVLVIILGNVLAPAVSALILTTRQEKRELDEQLKAGGEVAAYDSPHQGDILHASPLHRRHLHTPNHNDEYVPALQHLGQPHSSSYSPQIKMSSEYWELESSRRPGGDKGTHASHSATSSSWDSIGGSYDTPSREVLLQALYEMQGLGGAAVSLPTSPSPLTPPPAQTFR